MRFTSRLWLGHSKILIMFLWSRLSGPSLVLGVIFHIIDWWPYILIRDFVVEGRIYVQFSGQQSILTLLHYHLFHWYDLPIVECCVSYTTELMSSRMFHFWNILCTEHYPKILEVHEGSSWFAVLLTLPSHMDTIFHKSFFLTVESWTLKWSECWWGWGLEFLRYLSGIFSDFDELLICLVGLS